MGRVVDTCTGDDVWLKKHANTVDELIEAVIEVFETRPESLLSPIIRKMVAEKAHKLKLQRSALAGHAYIIDNPGSVSLQENERRLSK